MGVRKALRDGLLELTIDTPPVNAFGIGLLNDLAETIEAAGREPAERAVLVHALGRGFCAGGDVKEVEALGGFEGILGQASGSLLDEGFEPRSVTGSLRVLRAILECPLPVVFGVHGYCVGVGVLLTAAADLIVASPDARFVLAEIDNGATAGGVMAARLMPEKRARAAMMTAEPVLAEELHRYGAIHRLAKDAAAVEHEARGTAAVLAAKEPEAMRRLKRSLHGVSRAAEIEAAYRAELSFTYELNMLGEASRGRRDFLEGARPGYAAVPGPD